MHQNANITHPEAFHHLVAVDTKLLGIPSRELTDGERPTVKTGAESDSAAVGVHLDIAKGLVDVGRNDDVDRLNGTREGLVEVLLGDLELEERTVDLVDDNDGLNTLTEGLPEHSLGLNAHTLDGVDDDESTVSDTEGSSDLGREINVTGRVDQVDKEVLAYARLLASERVSEPARPEQNLPFDSWPTMSLRSSSSGRVP